MGCYSILERFPKRTYLLPTMSLVRRNNSYRHPIFYLNKKWIRFGRSSQTEYEVTFRFYGSNSHENHLRSVINKWGEIGYIGNMTVVNPDIAFYKESIILSIQVSPFIYFYSSGVSYIVTECITWKVPLILPAPFVNNLSLLYM